MVQVEVQLLKANLDVYLKLSTCKDFFYFFFFDCWNCMSAVVVCVEEHIFVHVLLTF